MSLACSWTHVDSLDSVATVFTVVMVLQFNLSTVSLLCFWDGLATFFVLDLERCCTFVALRYEDDPMM